MTILGERQASLQPGRAGHAERQLQEARRGVPEVGGQGRNSIALSQNIFGLVGHPVKLDVLGPKIILVRGCENVAGKLRQEW